MIFEDNIHRFDVSNLTVIDDGLSLAFNFIEEIPMTLIQSISYRTIKRLDFTECRLRQFKNLKYFSSLEVLILDKNELENLDTCPSIPSLHTLWCNNNKISDLETFIGEIGIKFPRIKYLSMMRNPACPGLMDLTRPDIDAIVMYRMYVIYCLPQLDMIDADYVTDEERAVALVKGKYAIKRKLEIMNHSSTERTYPSFNSISPLSTVDNYYVASTVYTPKVTISSKDMAYSSMSSDFTYDELISHPNDCCGTNLSVVGKVKFVRRVTGIATSEPGSNKHSEGNRYIRNNEL